MPRTMTRLASLCAAALLAAPLVYAEGKPAAKNPRIDMPGHLRLASAAARHRESHRVSEAEFLRMSAEPGTVILDARSARRYEALHVRGAVNLSFPDIAVASLAELVPDKGSRILIYCNNNFTGAEDAFPTKIAPASLNLSTYITLYSYGYRNVFELAPVVDVKRTVLKLEGRQSTAAR